MIRPSPEYVAGFCAGYAAAADFLERMAPRPHEDARSGSVTRTLLDLARMLRDHAANVVRRSGGSS